MKTARVLSRKDPRQAEQEFFDAVDFFAAGATVGTVFVRAQLPAAASVEARPSISGSSWTSSEWFPPSTRPGKRGTRCSLPWETHCEDDDEFRLMTSSAFGA